MGCAPLCVCASPDTPIATPTGERPIASLRVGDLVYTADRGAVKIAPLLEVRRTPVRAHQIMQIRLANGRLLELSPGHPTADGRRFQDLRAGDLLDGILIASARTSAYATTRRTTSCRPTRRVLRGRRAWAARPHPANASRISDERQAGGGNTGSSLLDGSWEWNNFNTMAREDGYRRS
jgi:hypothetical protein